MALPLQARKLQHVSMHASNPCIRNYKHNLISTIEGFTNGFIPSMLLVESDLIALIGGRLRYHLALSKAKFRFDLHRAVKGLRDSVSALMWDKILKPVYDRTAGETLIGTVLALHDVSDKLLNLVVEKGFSTHGSPQLPSRLFVRACVLE